ncbi:MAG: hypothetical protein D6705_16945 [Deltaproteobacteria bacterium]|nr:MAG: hypothetical protein D6705_16945 [Deltaproteobacteria bacterium]
MARSPRHATWILGLLVVGCTDRKAPDRDAAPTPSTRATAQPETADAPFVHPPSTDDEASMPYATTQGVVAAVVDGTPTRFETLPIGTNAWIRSPRTRRLTITGEAGPNREPRLQIYVYGIDIEPSRLPLRLAAQREAGRVVEIRYDRDGRRWVSQPGTATVTIADVADGRFRGTFEGELEPTVPNAARVRIAQGTFDVAVRLGGPRPTAPQRLPAPPEPTPKRP